MTTARRLPLAGVLAVAVLTAGMGAPSAATTTDTDPTASSTLSWGRCSNAALRSFECASLEVPLDWARPAGGTTRIALTRHRSTGTPAHRTGSLFFNPGGPGGSGLASAPGVYALLPAPVRRRFDFVTWDPRGVGRSDGIDDCQGGELSPPATGVVAWPDLVRAFRESQVRASEACLRAHPRIIPHMGTNMVVRDLDAMRAAVGDPRLTYWGLSYGTRIGYTYARTFPGRIRAIVLDGSVNPDGSIADLGMGYGTAAESALGMFFQMYPETSPQYQHAYAALSRAPLRLPSGRTFSRWNLRDLLQSSAGFERLGEASWVTAAQWLARITTAIDGSGATARQARRALDRLRPSANFEGAGGAAAVIDCTDYADRPTVAEQDTIARRTRLEAPITGWHNGLMMVSQCQGLDVPTDPVPTDFGTDRSTPLLLLGSTRDARTPYVWTAAMARAFRAARVVTYIGGQHGDYVLPGSGCVNATVNRFLLHRALPSHDTACPQVGRGTSR